VAVVVTEVVEKDVLSLVQTTVGNLPGIKQSYVSIQGARLRAPFFVPNQ
jgi:hypothetical protein